MFVTALLLRAATIGSEAEWLPPDYATGGLSYWQSRHIVTLSLHCQPGGSVDSVAFFASFDSSANVDSLAMLATTWRIPPPTSRTLEGKPFVAFAHFAGTVDTSQLRSLPPETRERILKSGPLFSWVEATEKVADDFDLRNLWTLGTVQLHESSWQFSSGFLDRRLDLGVALLSPGGGYAIDSFAGVEITDADEAAWDVDTGFATYDMRSNKRLHYWVSTAEGVAVAEWVDSTRFVLGGTVRLDHPSSRPGSWADAWVPCVWLGDVVTGEIARYLGVPLQPAGTAEYRAGMETLRPQLYPRVAW